jgi:DNA polymerase-3 subunit epsilon
MQLTRPLCFFDTETTGANPAKDRIVSIAVIKCFPDGSHELRNMLLDPECEIPAGATEVHGITNEMVQGKPKFRQIAKALWEFLSDSDIGGYNITGFDIQIMAEEFGRYNNYVLTLPAEQRATKQMLEYPIPNTLVLDSCVIFKKKEERTLSAAVQFYLNRQMEDAHDAQADTKASLEVFEAQLKHYPDLQEKSLEELAEFCKYDGPKRIDLAGVFLVDADGDAIFGRGKHKDKKCSTQRGYIDWMINKSEDGTYTMDTLKVARRIYDTLK